MATSKSAATKIATFEELLNERLKVELQRVHDERTDRLLPRSALVRTA